MCYDRRRPGGLNAMEPLDANQFLGAFVAAQSQVYGYTWG